jgi:hypothetical protein
VQLQRKLGEVADQEVEDLVDHIVGDVIDAHVLEDQLGVDYEREQLATGEEEVGVLGL